jgi:hypothetical protein
LQIRLDHHQLGLARIGRELEQAGIQPAEPARRDLEMEPQFLTATPLDAAFGQAKALQLVSALHQRGNRVRAHHFSP